MEAERPAAQPTTADAPVERSRETMRASSPALRRLASVIAAYSSIALIIVEGPARRSPTRALNGPLDGSIYALGAVGLTLVYGILKLVNFAHGDFLTFGAYMAYLVNVTWELPLVVGGLLGDGRDRAPRRSSSRRRCGGRCARGARACCSCS